MLQYWQNITPEERDCLVMVTSDIPSSVRSLAGLNLAYTKLLQGQARSRVLHMLLLWVSLALNAYTVTKNTFTENIVIKTTTIEFTVNGDYIEICLSDDA